MAAGAGQQQRAAAAPARRTRRPRRCRWPCARGRGCGCLPGRGAVTARVVRLHGDLLPGPDIGDVVPHRHHLADELVTHDARVVDGSVSVPDPVVGAAEARGEHAHDGLAGTGRRLRALLDPHVPGPAEDGGVHGAHPSGSPHSRQARRVLGQVASQPNPALASGLRPSARTATPEGASGARRTCMYVERRWRPRTWHFELSGSAAR